MTLLKNNSNTPAQNHSLSSEILNEIEQLKDSAASILKDEAMHLQVIPAVAVKLLKLSNDEDSSFSQLSFIIETEPSLSIEVLRLVNSAYFNFPHKINSIKRAVTVLGLSEIRKIALNLLFFKKIIKSKGQQEFNQIFFWQHCLFVAALSKTIALKINHSDPDTVYAAGLLHDIGKIVLETHGQLTYSDLLISFDKSSNSLSDNEHNFFGITHAEIGAVFCHLCDLPESIINVVLNHHRSFKSYDISAGNQQDIAIVAYADFIAWLQRIGSVDKTHYPILQPEVIDIINTLNLDIEAILEEVDKEIRDISVFYGIQFPSLNKLRANLVETIFNLGFKGNADQEIRYNENSSKQLVSSQKHHACLTAPHHSLNPDEFIPWTLEAIYKEYHFERLIILDIDPKHRSLIAKYWWPETIISDTDNKFEIMISSLSGQLLSCLRDKKPVLINALCEEDKQILQELSVSEFFSLPISMNNRLSSLLYIDNALSGGKLDNKQLTELDNICTELGIALVNANQFEHEKKKAQIDPLTGLKNKRMIHQFLTNNFNADNIQLEKLAIGFIDIDFFKKFNDTYGHKAGDDVLKIVADVLNSLTRPDDFIGRYGGEEFLFIIVNIDAEGARVFSERIRSEIEKKGIMLKGRFPQQSLSVSIGVAMYDKKYLDYQMMIDAADAAMYQSKKEGRNRVTVFSAE